jgi:hypothetical protein
MIWLNPEELKEIGVSKGILHRNREKWTWRQTGRRGRNGKMIDEVLLESMPQRFQVEYLKRSGADVSTSDCSLTTESPDRPAELGGDAGDDAVSSGLTGEQRLTEALLRYRPEVRERFLAESRRLASIVERYSNIDPKRVRDTVTKKHVFVSDVLQLCNEAVCTDAEILRQEPSRGKPKSPHTLDAWLKQYRADGLAAFLRRAPLPASGVDNRKAVISAGAVEWVNKNWKRFPSSRKMYQALQRQAAKHGWKIPAESYFWRRYRGTPQLVKTLTFEGEKAYQAKFAPFLPRTVEDLAALQVLCGDHSVRDVTVMLPDGTLTRPWLTLWLDLRTYLIWGWHLDLTPSSNTIGLAYVNGVQNFGAQPVANPAANFESYLYTDQGKDYKCKTLTGDTIEFKKAARIEGGLEYLTLQREIGFMKEMGLRHIMARGYNAKEKPVERVHKDISNWERNTFASEYCGKDTVSRPEAWRRAWTKHESLRKKIGMHAEWLRSESPFMTLDDYRDNLAGWIHEHNSTAHTRTVLGGAQVVPLHEYERLYTTRYEIADETLALMLMRAAKKKVSKDGVEMFQRGWYFGSEDLSEFKGLEIEVRYTDGDYSRIWAILPATDQKPSQVVELPMLTRSSIVNPNKKTMEQVSKMKAHERKLAKEYQLLEQSNWRGETTEDRVADLINPDDVQPPEQERIAVNAQPRIIVANSRFDRPKVTSRGGVTAEDVEQAEVIQGMFGDNRAAEPATDWIKEEWED